MNPVGLVDGLGQLAIDSTAAQLDRLRGYLALLQKWNRAYNLTAITEPQRMVTHHLLDSLSIVDAIPQRARCLDVGTGAGLPGIPLAIMRPDSSWVLLDSNGKKTRFVQQVVAECELANVKVVQARVQDYHADSPFAVIVSRAYASLLDYLTSVDHLWHANTHVLSMKAALDDAELVAVRQRCTQLAITELTVPGLADRRCLVTLER